MEKASQCCSAAQAGAVEVDPHNHAGTAALAGEAGRPGLWSSARATMHCLTGCTIGEVLGLVIGVSAGFTPFWTIVLAVTLAFVIGFILAIRSVQATEGLSVAAAFRAIWLGEVISMGVMELVMNVVDYSVGGMQTGTIFSGLFWLGLGLAIPAGFLAAWPVNYWLLSREIKQCCH